MWHLHIQNEEAYLRGGQNDQDRDVKVNEIQESSWGVAWLSEHGALLRVKFQTLSPTKKLFRKTVLFKLN